MASLKVNMSDPQVQKFLGLDGPKIAAPGKEIVQVAGDVPPPDGGAERGVATTWHLNRSAVGHPIVVYKDMVLVMDVYEVPGEPLKVQLICPRCKHALTIPGNKKQIEFSRAIGAPNPSNADLERAMLHGSPRRDVIAAFGVLSVEPFECTWEIDATRSEFGTSLCRWRVGIDENIAKDA